MLEEIKDIQSDEDDGLEPDLEVGGNSKKRRRTQPQGTKQDESTRRVTQPTMAEALLAFANSRNSNSSKEKEPEILQKS